MRVPALEARGFRPEGAEGGSERAANAIPVTHALAKENDMSIRPVQRIVKSKPTLEGAGVHLRRAFGFGNTSDYDPFLLLDDFRNDRPEDYLAGFPGTRIAGSKRSPTCWPARWTTPTAWGTRARSRRATSSG
jgi:hypothetical protein